MTEQLFVILQNAVLPVDDLLVDEQFQQGVVFGNQLHLANRMNTVHLIPLLISVRRQ